MKILIASDHAGFELKKKLFAFLKEENFDVEDMGVHVHDANDDYPKIMIPVAMMVVSDPENTRAILIGKSGNGEAMIANRFPGIRAAVYYGGNVDIIRLSREHNNANVLALGAGFIEEEEAKLAVKMWISTSFSGDARHVKRNDMLDNIE